MPELGTSVFIIPGTRVKNGDERLVVMNSIATLVVVSRRGTHPEFGFTYEGRPVTKTLTSAWKTARIRAQVRVHDLKHTFGRRQGRPG